MCSNQVSSTLNSLTYPTTLTSPTDDLFSFERSKSKTLESCQEEELENHEGSSTISGSLRVNNDINLSNTSEADTQSIKSDPFDSALDNENQNSNFPFSMANDVTLSQEVDQYYNGCFFGDLEIEFTPSEQNFFEDDEEESALGLEDYSYDNGYFYNSYRPNYYRSTAYAGKTSYQQRQYKGNRNNYDSEYYITYQPKNESQTSQKTTGNELYTTPSEMRDLNYTQSLNHSKSLEKYGPGQTTTTKAHQTTPISSHTGHKIPKSEKKERSQAEVNDNKGSSGAQSGVHSDIKNKIEGKDVSPKRSKVLNRRQKKAVKGQGKEKKSEDFKLWDKINVKGKLKF